MRNRLIILLLGSIIWGFTSCTTTKIAVFEEIYTLTEQKNYFKAKATLEYHKKDISRVDQAFFGAIINNAFNKLDASQQTIQKLLKKEQTLSDSLVFKLLETKCDNELKLYRYQDAKNTVSKILTSKNAFLTEKEKNDYENALKIWTALEEVSPQHVDIKATTTLKIVKDFAGLNTLNIKANKDSMQFIFDTGANISTTSLSVAKQCGMTLIPSEIEVGTITGGKVNAQLAVCDTLSLGNIDLFNVVFLVFPDEALYIPEIDYRIYGILGYPVIEALKEIRISQNGDFTVPMRRSENQHPSNLAMTGLTPLICLNDKHFFFDTGANETILFERYYLENKDAIEANHTRKKINFAGAGGNREFDGYEIDLPITIGGKEIVLSNISLLAEKRKEDETVYGNIGQDLIQNFETMILNFDAMFIVFE